LEKKVLIENTIRNFHFNFHLNRKIMLF